MTLSDKELEGMFSALSYAALSLLHRARAAQKKASPLDDLNDTQVLICRGLASFGLMYEAKRLGKGPGKSDASFRLTSTGEDLIDDWARRHEAARMEALHR